MDPEIKMAIELMLEKRVRRIRTDRFEVELDPSAFVARPTDQPDDAIEDETRCRCGHLDETEHAEGGCLFGCDHERCLATGPTDDGGES